MIGEGSIYGWGGSGSVADEMEASRRWAEAQETVSINCPITGQVCPSRERAVRLFTEASELSPEQSSFLKPELDGLKLQARLTELTTQANLRGCDGVTLEGDCPVALELRDSRPRQTAIKGIRSLLRRTNA